MFAGVLRFEVARNAVWTLVSGEFVTLRELRSEVGNDAARLFYVLRSNDQHLDFDLDLAKSRTNENPVYYIQYAHARICSVFRNLEDQDTRHNVEIGIAAIDQLAQDHELALMRNISRYPETIESSARLRSPHEHLRLAPLDGLDALGTSTLTAKLIGAIAP